MSTGTWSIWKFSPAIDELYANPTPWIHGNMLTIGSTAVMAYYPILRRAGAQIRKTLLQMAADLWGVPAAELHTEPSRVVHDASGQSLTYGEVAARGIVPNSLPEVSETELKLPVGVPTHRQRRPATYRYAGQGARRARLQHRRAVAEDALRDRETRPLLQPPSRFRQRG